MLSYQHAYHAGNFADVLKHVVLIDVLQYLCQKDKPIRYIDTHAGDGIYPVARAQMQRLQEYRTGVYPLWEDYNQASQRTTATSPPLPEGLNTYLTALRHWNRDTELRCYPGSPALAFQMLRQQDQLQLAELHPKAFTHLEQAASKNFEMEQHQAAPVARPAKKHPRVLTFKTDGFKHLRACLPPQRGRACVLMDPAYEVKTDYDTVVNAVKLGHGLCQTGVFLVWYPIVDRAAVTRLKTQFKQSGIKNISCIELGIAPDSTAHGMTGSGLIVVNGPWNLKSRLEESLAWLCQRLSTNANGYWLFETLVGEG